MSFFKYRVSNLFLIKGGESMSDLIKILLQAEVDPSAINNIKTQLNSIQTNVKPVNISVNTTGTQSISGMVDALDKLENVTKKNLMLDLERMAGRYKNLVRPEDIANIKSMIGSLSHTDPKLGYNIDLIRTKMKEVSVGAEQSRKSMDLANKSAMSFGEAMKQAAYKFGIQMPPSIAIY